jgi:hypothetical protein
MITCKKRKKPEFGLTEFCQKMGRKRKDGMDGWVERSLQESRSPGSSLASLIAIVIDGEVTSQSQSCSASQKVGQARSINLDIPANRSPEGGRPPNFLMLYGTVYFS